MRNHPTRYASAAALAARYAVDHATIWRWAKSGRLPAPVKLSPGCTRWRLDEIETRDAECEAARGTATAAA